MNNVYEQTGDYMPRTDDGFWHWLQNFSSLISQNPQRFALTTADAEIIANHFAAYDELWQKCKQPSLRTTTLIAKKDAVKASAMGSCRVFAMMIKGIAGVDDESKIALGLHVDDTTPTVIGPPTTAPLLKVSVAHSGVHRLGYSDETMPTRQRKPQNIKFIEIARNIAWGPCPNVETAVHECVYSRQPVTIEQEQKHAGFTATYFGRWVTARGLKGPWSLPVSMTICFGGPVEVSALSRKPGEIPPGITVPDGLTQSAARLKRAA